MTLEQKVFEKLQDLPPEKRKVALGFVESITEEDIAEAHRELWENFPRDIAP
jgi:hypothetical protein